MKLNTLLLTSAATLMATSVAFAADLPSKKAAPAAGSVQVCKVGGMTGFTLPGSDTCFAISGRVTVDFQNSDLDSDYFGSSVLGPDGGVGYRLNFDARSNTELGVVRSFVSLTGVDSTYARKAFIQVGGFTAGLKDSLADISGSQGNLFGNGWTQSSTGVDYQVNVGGLTLGIGAEDQLASDYGTGGEMPDLIAALSGKAGAVSFKLAGVSHEDPWDDSTYAILGSASAELGQVSLFGWAGYGDAGSYFGGSGSYEYSGNYFTSYGAGATFKASAATSVSLQFAHVNDDDCDCTDWNSYGIYVSHQLAKNLTIQPEVVVKDGYDNDTSWNNQVSALVRIERDF